MKLRIHNDSIRFRFTRDEVQALSSGKPLVESVAMGPLERQRLSYRIVPEQGVPEISGIQVELEANTLTVSVPSHVLRAWCEGEQLALEAEQTWTTGRIRILLEKDMQRLNPKDGEESAGVYPNPLFGKVRCDHP
ncbi:MAG: DUF7009 family protein [Bryobacteraceae bacterium]